MTSLNTLRDREDPASQAWRQGDLHTAIAVFESLPELHGDVPARCRHVRRLWALRKREAAMRELAPVLDLEEHPDVLTARGVMALGLPDHPLHISIVYGSSNRDDDAASSLFGRAVEIEPTCVDAWRGLAMTHRLAWRFDDASRAIGKGLAIVPESPGLLAESVWLSSERGPLIDALLDAESFISSRPDEMDVLLAGLRVARTVHDYARAAAWLSLLEQACVADSPVVLLERAAFEMGRVDHETPAVYALGKSRMRASSDSLRRLVPDWPVVIDVVMQVESQMANEESPTVTDCIRARMSRISLRAPHCSNAKL